MPPRAVIWVDAILQQIRSLAFAAFTIAWMLAVGAAIPWLALTRNPVRVRGAARLWCRGMLAGLRALCGLGSRELGAANRPHGPAIYACNHESYWEALAFPVIVPDVAIIVKRSLFRLPLAGWFLRRSPMIAVDRDGGGAAMRAMVRAAADCAAAGRSILIFPDGTFRDATTAGSFRGGVAALQHKLGLPVVPVVVDSGRFWPGHGRRVRPGTVTVSFLPPIPPGLPARVMLARLEMAIHAAQR